MNVAHMDLHYLLADVYIYGVHRAHRNANAIAQGHKWTLKALSLEALSLEALSLHVLRPEPGPGQSKTEEFSGNQIPALGFFVGFPVS